MATSCQQKQRILNEMKLDTTGFSTFGKVTSHSVPHHGFQIRDAFALGADATAGGIVPSGHESAILLTARDVEANIHVGVWRIGGQFSSLDPLVNPMPALSLGGTPERRLRVNPRAPGIVGARNFLSGRSRVPLKIVEMPKDIRTGKLRRKTLPMGGTGFGTRPSSGLGHVDRAIGQILKTRSTRHKAPKPQLPPIFLARPA